MKATGAVGPRSARGNAAGLGPPGSAFQPPWFQHAKNTSHLAEASLLAGAPHDAVDQASRVINEANKLSGRDVVVPLLLRVRGVGEALSGTDGGLGQQHVEHSAEVARARNAPYELALSLQAMADLWPASVPHGLQAEKDALFEQLGVLPAARSLRPIRAKEAAASLPC